MKIRQLILVLVALGFVLAPQLSGTAFGGEKRYSAKLISPKPGEVLIPGKVVRIEWKADFPNVDLSMCETELLLSLDGGQTIYTRLTEQRNPTVQYLDWVVPNVASSRAVLIIRFGCLNLYPETSAAQLQSTFTIGPAVN